IPVNYILLGGTSLGMTRDLVLNPTIMVRSDLNAYTFDLSAVAVYQEKMWGGLTFRRSESISLLLGYSFLEGNKLKAGYSFDYVVQNQDGKEPTSHEIFLRYDLPGLILGGRKAVKTPRFTF
ncbi:MAG: type IX secretion system membrane protein PorP/SprF, partial [Bacteroidota bacterium]